MWIDLKERERVRCWKDEKCHGCALYNQFPTMRPLLHLYWSSSVDLVRNLTDDKEEQYVRLLHLFSLYCLHLLDVDKALWEVLVDPSLRNPTTCT